MGLFGRRKATVEEAKSVIENPVPGIGDSFEKELTFLINKYSLENLSNTPDFILAFYLKDCLVAWQNAQQRRTQWFTDKASEHRPSQMAQID